MMCILLSTPMGNLQTQMKCTIPVNIFDVLDPVLVGHPSTKPLFTNKDNSAHSGDVGGSKLSFLDFSPESAKASKDANNKLGEHRGS